MKELKELKESPFNIYKEYPPSVGEAFIVLIIIQAILDKPIDFYQVIKSSLVIGVLICIAMYFNKEFKENVKQGLHYGISSIIISQFAPIN